MAGERYPHVSTEGLIAAYQAGATLKVLAAETGMNEWSVRMRITRGGGKIRPAGSHNKPRGTLEEVFAASFEQRGPNECWPWTGTLTQAGYGTISVGRFRATAQRAAVILQGQAIPEGYEVDHLCFNPPCVNPSHLEVVTSAENKRRRRMGPKSHCRRGHPLTDDNIETERDGKVRRCAICRKKQKARQRAQNRGEIS